MASASSYRHFRSGPSDCGAPDYYHGFGIVEQQSINEAMAKVRTPLAIGNPFYNEPDVLQALCPKKSARSANITNRTFHQLNLEARDASLRKSKKEEVSL
jgi:hypothetical protein